MTDTCFICLQDKPCPCEAPTMQRPDVIPCLKHILKRQYEDGYDSACDTLEETIVELERLRDVSKALHEENRHLRAMNIRMAEALSECMPISCNPFFVTSGEGGQTPAVTPTKPPETGGK